MKGIEGLALKYILVILVAALVIGTVFSLVTSFTDTVRTGGGTLSNTTSAGITALNAETCNSMPNCVWNSTASDCVCIT